MKKILSILLCLPLFLSACGQKDITKNNPDWSRYTNRFAGYEISYPKNYTIEEIPEMQSVAFVGPQKKNEIIISIPKLPRSGTGKKVSKEINTYKTTQILGKSQKSGKPITYTIFERPGFEPAQTNTGVTQSPYKSADGKNYFVELRGSGDVYQNMVQSFVFVPYKTRSQYLADYFKNHLLELSPENIEKDKDENGFPLWEVYDIDLLSKENHAYVKYRHRENKDKEREMDVHFNLKNNGDVQVDDVERIVDPRKEIRKYLDKHINDLAFKKPAPKKNQSGAVIGTGSWKVMDVDYKWGYKALITYTDGNIKQQMMIRYALHGYDVIIHDHWDVIMWWRYEGQDIPLQFDYPENYHVNETENKISLKSPKDNFLSIKTIWSHSGNVQNFMDQKFSQIQNTGSVAYNVYKPGDRLKSSANNLGSDAIKKGNIIDSDGIDKRFIFFQMNTNMYVIKFSETKDMDILKTFDRIIKSIRPQKTG